jgi:hypothetical protein
MDVVKGASDMPVIFLTLDEEIDELFGLKMGAESASVLQRLLVEGSRRCCAAVPGVTLPHPEADAAKVLERGSQQGSERYTHPEERAGHPDGYRIPDPTGAATRLGGSRAAMR